MFRAAAAGPYDEAVAKATDENMTTEDWGAIMDLCDRVSTDTNGAKESVQALIKRLAHRNANVQLYTLELANALSQNCGKPLHRELSSRAFTDALLKLANDRNTHAQVKTKVAERMAEWAEMFSKDSELGIMNDAYHRLKQANPQLQPPSAPTKDTLTATDRQKEEDELQMALNLSLQEEERKKTSQSSTGGPNSRRDTSATPISTDTARPEDADKPIRPTPTGTTAATISRVRALYDFQPADPGELEFKKGDVIAVLGSVFKDWWRGSLKGRTGIFPLNYVEKLSDPTPAELERESRMEAEVFAEIKNVEKLLTLLSTNTGPREEDNEEISKLYHQTLAIRPKLINLIEKYSQKKDDFTQLNEKFIKARRDYEALLEASMSHPPRQQQHQQPQQYPPYNLRPAGTPAYGIEDRQQRYSHHEPGRYYTPAPGSEPQYGQHRQSMPAGYQRPNGASPAPFYVAGAEVPQGAAGSPQHMQHQQYPGRDRIPSDAYQPPPQQPSPAQSHYAGPPNQYPPYAHQQLPVEQRPQSTYGNPQELATSAYDSPITTHNPHLAMMYPQQEYEHDDPYGAESPAASTVAPSAPSAPSPMPSGPQEYNQTPHYQDPQQFSQQQQQQQPAPYSMQSEYTQPHNPQYEPRQDSPQVPPPMPPTAYPPPIPNSLPPHVGSPDPLSMTPLPLRPGGSRNSYVAHDARQSLPSQYHARPSEGAPAAAVGAVGAGQYKAFVPSAPADQEPSAPGDYYR